MALSHNTMHSEAAIVTEFYAKSLRIILESRSPYMSSRNFSGEQVLSSPMENLDLWRPSNLEPMVVDVILVHRPQDWVPLNLSPKRVLVRNLSSKELYPFCWNSAQEELGCETKSEKIVERWEVQYDSRKIRDSSSGSRDSVLLLRSLYTTVRLLPAYKIFRDLNSSGQILTFTLAHRVSSFVEPFTLKEETAYQRFGFTPVDTSSGRLCISVLYRSSISEVSSEPSTPMSPQFIPDYVGSPLADPLKRFPSLPMSHGSPSSLPFPRCHSWSFDHYKPSLPSVSFSPSPTHSEPNASVSNRSSHCYHPVSLPPHPPESSLVHKNNKNFDEYYPSPKSTPFPSPSRSPSPPIYTPGSYRSKGRLPPESAPFCLPAVKCASSPALSSKQNLSPSPSFKNIKSTSKIDRSMGPIQTGATIEKILTIGKDDSRRYSGVKLSSRGSPQISFSRSSSRSYQDEFDDEFPCPFDVEDVDVIDRSSRPGSFDQKGAFIESLESGGLFPVQKSQDAAVGALVCLLKKAPPLQQDFSGGNSIGSSQISEAPSGQHAISLSVASSGIVASKTTADALAELRGYEEMKNLLLSQRARSQSLVDYTSTT